VADHSDPPLDECPLVRIGLRDVLQSTANQMEGDGFTFASSLSLRRWRTASVASSTVVIVQRWCLFPSEQCRPRPTVCAGCWQTQ
jgi:hypothetical protein